ncbi:hypothetical protein GCM10010112_81590 [Actinoplanes lobatus]|uniref:Uncharacterized protein n=1 Tax=Actinoplanes lobatus TaxID=113568 RepID=A0A7W7MGX6_9ACTN|nr:hypothetical protein [Actinoplanes lobatus]MBB4749854.1 hypothetical protein [Actinoplanes lobatus]GGN93402.1 hypothetical protein GCM10010112_81590 [Actinoplanes lobatus]
MIDRAVTVADRSKIATAAAAITATAITATAAPPPPPHRRCRRTAAPPPPHRRHRRRRTAAAAAPPPPLPPHRRRRRTAAAAAAPPPPPHRRRRRTAAAAAAAAPPPPPHRRRRRTAAAAAPPPPHRRRRTAAAAAGAVPAGAGALSRSWTFFYRLRWSIVQDRGLWFGSRLSFGLPSSGRFCFLALRCPPVADLGMPRPGDHRTRESRLLGGFGLRVAPQPRPHLERHCPARGVLPPAARITRKGGSGPVESRTG